MASQDRHTKVEANVFENGEAKNKKYENGLGEVDGVTSHNKKSNLSSRGKMTISLNGLQPSLDPSKVFSYTYSAVKAQQYSKSQTSSAGYSSAPPTAHAHCPTCGKSISDPLMFYSPSSELDKSLPGSSPLVVPMGPLAAAAFESGMSAVEELRLLKAQVQDVARVCNAVARGDLSQKITVPVQGVVMVQLKDVINTMVGCFRISVIIYSIRLLLFCRLTNLDNLQRKLHVYHKKSELRGKDSHSVYSCFFPWSFVELNTKPVSLPSKIQVPQVADSI